MSHHRNNPTRHQRRRGVTAIGLGAAAGALLAAVMSQLATAPTARADDFSDIVANVEASIAAGQADITAGQADFALGTSAGFADGLALDTAATDDFLVSPLDDILTGSVAAAVGETPGPGETYEFPDFAVPTSLADFEAEVTGDFQAGLANFENAETVFALGTPDSFATGVIDIINSLDFYTVIAPEQAVLGLADLSGF